MHGVTFTALVRRGKNQSTHRAGWQSSSCMQEQSRGALFQAQEGRVMRVEQVASNTYTMRYFRNPAEHDTTSTDSQEAI